MGNVAATDIEIHFDVYDRIDPGEYLAYCKEAEVQRTRYGEYSLFMLWEVKGTDGMTTIATVRRWLHVGSRKGKPHVGRGTLAWQWLTQANGEKIPTRGDRMTPRIFKNRMARILVADSRPPHTPKGEPQPIYEPYSKVSRVLSWETGR